MTNSSTRDAYTLGQTAYTHGRTQHQNPYNKQTQNALWAAWNNGWQKAKNDDFDDY